MQEIQQKQPEIAEMVLAKVTELQSLNQLKSPSDFHVGNAIKAAQLIISDIDNISTVVPASIYSSLMKMCVEGLNPLKHQCAFMIKGGKLICMRQYQGTIALAKRSREDMLMPKAHAVYEDDEFDYETEISSGRTQILKHKSSLKNRAKEKIIGAFCIVPFSDGTYDCCVMTLAEIKECWLMGSAKGNSPAHKNFPDQQCEKTVMNRALKLYIDGSSDDEDSEITEPKIQQQQQSTQVEVVDTENLFKEEATVIETPVIEVKSEEVSSTLNPTF